MCSPKPWGRESTFVRTKVHVHPSMPLGKPFMPLGSPFFCQAAFTCVHVFFCVYVPIYIYG